MTGPRLVRLRAPRSEHPGTLRVLEPLPFAPRRMFTVSAPRGTHRGGHAHRVCWQLLMVDRGVVSVRYARIVDGRLRTRHRRLEPGAALAVPPLTWLDLEFVTDADLVVLASHVYDAADYIDTLVELRRRP